MNRIAATITLRIGLVICLASLGCTNSTTPDDANSTTAALPPARSGSSDATDTDNEMAASDDTTPADPAATLAADPASPTDSVLEISFDDIELPIQQDMVFRPFMLTDRVKELDGKRIRISGYMLPDTRTKGIKQFVLLKNTECKFGPGGQADHLLNVLMVEGEDARYREEPVSIEGRLIVKPFEGPDGNTWSIYDIACDRVTRYRPRR